MFEQWVESIQDEFWTIYTNAQTLKSNTNWNEKWDKHSRKEFTY